MKNKRAFTLIELSISLLVIGLIMGSVVMSARMVQYAKVRTVAKEIATLSSSIYSFYDHYNALPGDMSNATSFWSSTANGNGNFIIEGDYISVNSPESYRAWQHLGLSGFYPQNFTGTSGSSAPTAVIGTNVPASAVEGGFYVLGHTSVYGTIFSVYFQHFIHFGSIDSGDHSNMGSILSPKDGYSLDVKIDDGVAYSGNLSGGTSNTSTYACSEYPPSTSYPYGYNFVNADYISCRFFFWLSLGMN